jgi:hypothetical protein
MNTEAMTANVCPVVDPRQSPLERGFDAYIAEVMQPIVDGSHDKDALMAWLYNQLDAWEREAKRTEPWVLWEGGPVLPFAAGDVSHWIELTLDRVDALEEREWARRRAKRGLILQITELETVARDEDFDEAAMIAEQVLAGIKRLRERPPPPDHTSPPQVPRREQRRA